MDFTKYRRVEGVTPGLSSPLCASMPITSTPKTITKRPNRQIWPTMSPICKVTSTINSPQTPRGSSMSITNTPKRATRGPNRQMRKLTSQLQRLIMEEAHECSEATTEHRAEKAN